MRIDYPDGVFDFHVHVGKLSSSENSFDTHELDGHIGKYGLSGVVVFGGDVNPLSETGKLKSLCTMNKPIGLGDIYALARFNKMDYKEKWIAVKEFVDKDFLGFKFHPAEDGYPINFSIYNPPLEYLNETGKIGLIHCGRWHPTSHSKYAFEVARRYPDAKFILAHMGGNEPELLKETLEELCTGKYPNVWVDTSNLRMSSLLKKYHDRAMSSKILFGSDTPFSTFLPNLFTVLDADITSDIKDDILKNNALDLIRSVV